MLIRGKNKNKNSNRSWLELPEELWENLLMRLATIERLLIAQKVCSHVIDMSNYHGLTNSHVFPYVCHDAVIRSQGELVDIRLTFYATKELLVYVAERSPKLKRLSIAWCNSKLDPKDLTEVVKKLPMLEELCLTYNGITKEGIEALGRFCPRLKLFENVEALAISKSLHVLSHLKLICNSMTNVGLQAILDGCCNLESLDLRGCFHVSLDKVLSSRISQQIKNMKYPRDSLVGFTI
ncbi:hypothetical protein R3W88_022082 [Solanum pinnatisectum]|uniref:Uncharacterized protein n=1 Tax=Solanum pinnatisectum TaxID=50273 RepID=A0AAV9LX17_9SOLN|nr:hypothetical protein R3W88_022082 [Solanum pinnatisectum]